MAGRGTRFKNAGVSKPKHEIIVRGEPMFDWAMRSLEGFYEEQFIFITQDEHDAAPFLRDACDRLSIPDYQQITLENYTNGQAQTALEADVYLSPEDSVAIYNIDTYINNLELTLEDISGDGFIPTFTASGEHWSFVRTDDSGHVTKVSEKQKISDTATVGFYYFDRWSDFVAAYERTAQQVAREYGETYVAPLYNYLIDEGRTVVSHRVDRDSVHVLGTPDELRQFDPEFSAESQ